MIAAVRLVLPWSIWPIVPMFTCGLVRSNFFLAIETCLTPSLSCGSEPYGHGFASEFASGGLPEVMEPTIGFEPMTSSLPRKCSAD